MCRLLIISIQKELAYRLIQTSILKKEYDTLKKNCVGYAKSAIRDKFVNDFFTGIPAEKFDKVIKKITQLKKSWEWKEALKQ